ncbi:MAG: methyltransferase domain-containing protein [Acidobacteria bacterium]|nr:MAG: methyltransferase domain-containing protein [Acidobacteriota bacterium]
MIDPASRLRIERHQERVSGGLLAPVDWSRLDHRRHHPGMEVEIRAAALIAGRQRRQRYVYEACAEPCASGRVVDVGCDRAHLRELVPGPYVGIDRWGDPDVRFDLLSGLPLPLADRCADFVICTDVLEHLYDPHFYCDELFRIARGTALIALPNCWAAFMPSISYGSPTYANYGLPPEPPGDAHRWSFCTEEAIDFVLYRAAGSGFRCTRMIHFADRHAPLAPRWPDRGLAGRIAGKLLDLAARAGSRLFERHGTRSWLNRQVVATWWLLAREEAARPGGPQR